MKRLIIVITLLTLSIAGNAQQVKKDTWHPREVGQKKPVEKQDNPQCWGTVTDKTSKEPRRCKNIGLEKYQDKYGHWYCYSHRNQIN